MTTERQRSPEEISGALRERLNEAFMAVDQPTYIHIARAIRLLDEMDESLLRERLEASVRMTK